MSTKYKGEDIEERYISCYEETFRLCFQTINRITIKTRFGDTNVNMVGDDSRPKLLLIHGNYVNSSMWYPNIDELNKHFKLYMIDFINAPGEFIFKNKMNSDDFAQWLLEIVDFLKLEKVNIIGFSLGAYYALNFSIYHSNRINKMILMSPGDFTPLKIGFFVRLFKGLLPWTGLKAIKKMHFNDNKVNIPDSFIMQFFLGVKNYIPSGLNGIPTKMKIEDYKKVSLPILLLLGEQDKGINSKMAYTNAKELIPHIQPEIIPNCGHLINLEAAEYINKAIREFLL
ncbi:MAG: alpha/beta hydrolase [Bacillota bacterium]|nr:alpha/beta hydrolase [Bacillota bacterium]